jgi:peptidoglycan/xylan/chitin deacetylase (PgdA/CDA1 family)
LLIRIKKYVKSTVAALAYATGLLQVLATRRLAGGAAVLMYHRVLPRERLAESFSAESISVTPETFRRQMRLLSRLTSPLSVADLERAMSTGQFPKRACVVTFDDGWYDNLDYALPILAEFRIPAVIFLAVDYIGTGQCFWQERLSRLLYAASRSGPESRELLDGFGAARVQSLEGDEARRAIREVINSLKGVSVAERDAAIARVESWLAARRISVHDGHPDRFLDWDGVKKLTTSGVITIGSHCCSHTPLPKLSERDVDAELTRSRATIRERIGSDPRTLAYPNGDYTTDIAAQAARHYGLAFTTERGFVTRGDAPTRLRRFNVHEHSTDTDGTFLARIAGLI